MRFRRPEDARSSCGEARIRQGWRWADIPLGLAFIVPTQLVMVEAIVHSSRVSGDIGAVIGAVELLLALAWTGLLWREVRRSRRAHPS